MKRDLDLVRDILLKVEKNENLDGQMWMDFKDSKHSQKEIVLHLIWLSEAGYLKLVEGAGISSDDENPVVTRLTWEGCEFLESARDDQRWKKAKEIGATLGNFSFQIIFPVLVELAKQDFPALLKQVFH